jgi:delta-aminolevulinic acid dehydratase/porphobilinogen synthase
MHYLAEQQQQLLVVTDICLFEDTTHQKKGEISCIIVLKTAIHQMSVNRDIKAV